MTQYNKERHMNFTKSVKKNLLSSTESEDF
jgi:hypothetical protein